MNTTLIPSPTRTTLMPADVPTTTSPGSTPSDPTREGVNTVALIEIRRQRTVVRGRRRAWDELPEADRQVLLREARLRMQREREQRAARDAQEMTLYALRGQR